MFDYRFTLEGEVLTIAIEGRFDAANAQTTLDELETYREKDVSKVIFDLSKTTFMASAGLRNIVYARKLKEDMVVVVKGACDVVAKVLEMSGISKLVEMTA